MDFGKFARKQANAQMARDRAHDVKVEEAAHVLRDRVLPIVERAKAELAAEGFALEITPDWKPRQYYLPTIRIQCARLVEGKADLSDPSDALEFKYDQGMIRSNWAEGQGRSYSEVGRPVAPKEASGIVEESLKKVIESYLMLSQARARGRKLISEGR